MIPVNQINGNNNLVTHSNGLNGTNGTNGANDVIRMSRNMNSLQNLFNVGKNPYVAATPRKPLSIERTAILYASVFIDALKCILLSFPHFIMAIVYMVIPKSKKDIRGQTALVTGSGNGIGKEIARRLAKEGCNVAVADIDLEAANATVEELRKMNVKAYAYGVDVSDMEQVSKLKCDIERDFGNGLDILVNNAGIMTLISCREGSIEEVDRMIKINLNSQFYTIRTFIPGMIERRRGHIVGMSSMSGIHPTPQSCLYTATKFGIQGFLTALQEELRQEDKDTYIKITIAFPYFVSTRKDIMDAVNLRYPPVTAKRTANATVDGMLRNEHWVTIPSFLFYLVQFSRLLPMKCQQIGRDYILHERFSKVDWYAEGTRVK